MASGFDPPFVIEPKGEEHTRTIIFLHGRGSQGKEFAEEFFEGKTSSGQSLLEIFQDTKWIFPSAPKRYSTVFQEEIDEWFDIYSLSDPNERQELQKNGLKESTQFIYALIREEISAGVKPNNILLGGISQGFATAIHVLLSGSHLLGGFIGLSGWLPFSNIMLNNADAIAAFYQTELSIAASTSRDTLRTNAFISHARNDTVVESRLGKSAAEILSTLGLDVEWHEYEEGEHWVNEPRGYDDIAAFITSRA